MTADEREDAPAVPHRHTHRGPFEPGPLPDGLLARLQDDASRRGRDADRSIPRRARAEADGDRRRIEPRAGRTRDPRSTGRDTARWSREAAARPGTACPLMPSPLGQPYGRTAATARLRPRPGPRLAAGRRSARRRSRRRCSPWAMASGLAAAPRGPAPAAAAGRQPLGLRPPEYPAAARIRVGPDADQERPGAATDRRRCCWRWARPGQLPVPRPAGPPADLTVDPHPARNRPACRRQPLPGAGR